MLHGLLQSLLQFLGVHVAAVGQGYQCAGLSEGTAYQFLNTDHVPLHLIHLSPPFVLHAGLWAM